MKWSFLATILFCLTIREAWVGWHIHGAAYMWTTEQGNDVKDWVTEDERKKNMYFLAFFCAVGCFMIMRHVIGSWKERNDQEAHWLKAISDPEGLKHIHQNPALYRDDFKKWVDENHPHLKIWTLPPNSSN